MSSIMKGIVDEGEEVAVIYIDGKPSAKYAKKHEAERDAEFMRKRHPNKKIEIKHEVRETEEKSSPYKEGYKAWKDYLVGKTKQRPVNPYPAGKGMGAWEQGAGDAAEHIDWGEGPLGETAAKKGADGKRCWKGKRYAGTENGKDKCIPVKEGVIVGHDANDPEVAILGGAGTMSLSRLKKKAHGEALQLADDIANGKYNASSYNMKQLHNTLNTIVAAEKEMEKLYFGEDYTGEFAAEVTPAINPYGGLKDKKVRGAIGEALLSEMPDTSGAVGVQPGGWRTYSPKPAGQVDESRMHQYDINDAIKKVEAYRKSENYPSRGASTRLLNVLYQWYNTEPNNIITRAQLLRTPNMGKQAMALLDTLMGNVSKDESPYDQNKNQSLAIVDSLKQAIASDDMRSVLDLLRELKNSIGAMDRLSYKRVKEDTAYAGGMGQGHSGESYRKFKPKSAGTFKEEEQLDEGQYEMMLRNRQVKKFVAKDDADAKRIAAGHDAKSVIKLKGGVPAGKVTEEQLDEKCWDGYKQVGMKKKGDKMVPNCVAKESAIMKGLKR